MSPEDDRQLRSLVRQAVNASSLGVRQLERAMGLGSGYLERLLDGRLEIKVRHLVDLARLLRVPPSHFLHFGCPDANRSAVSSLGKVLGLKELGLPRVDGHYKAPDNAGAGGVRWVVIGGTARSTSERQCGCWRRAVGG